MFQESDQNFVLYVETISYNDFQNSIFSETLMWATNTANQGSNESELVVQDNGNVVMYEKSNMKGAVLWSTKPVEDYEFDLMTMVNHVISIQCSYWRLPQICNSC